MSICCWFRSSCKHLKYQHVVSLIANIGVNANWWYFIIFHPWLNANNHPQNAWLIKATKEVLLTLPLPCHFLLQNDLFLKESSVWLFSRSFSNFSCNSRCYISTCPLEQNPFKTWRWWYVCVCVRVCGREGGRRRKMGSIHLYNITPTHTNTHNHCTCTRTHTAHAALLHTTLGWSSKNMKNFPTNTFDA